MKPTVRNSRIILASVVAGALLLACATPPTDGARRSRIRDCAVGQVLICEDRDQRLPSRGDEEEIPEYEFCYCEDIM
jgi:hypothetical protein